MGTPVQYQIDAEKSLFTVHPFATGLAATLSHGLTIAIPVFTGVLHFVPETLEKASLQVRIRTESLTVTDQMETDDRVAVERTMREQVLRVSDHPEVVFESSSVKAVPLGGHLYRADVEGNLTINGITRVLSFITQVVLAGETLRANGSFKTKQTDFGIPLVTAGGGLIKVHDELKFHFYIVAQRLAEKT